jgi:hypothetical protein
MQCNAHGVRNLDLAQEMDALEETVESPLTQLKKIP